MTISLEEHVARALEPMCRGFGPGDMPKAIAAEFARAAIAAMRQYEGAARVQPQPFHPGRFIIDGGKDNTSYPSEAAALAEISSTDPASIRETERAACEAIARVICGDSPANSRAMRIVAAIAARRGKGEGK